MLTLWQSLEQVAAGKPFACGAIYFRWFMIQLNRRYTAAT
jgi:hypothetical protein